MFANFNICTHFHININVIFNRKIRILKIIQQFYLNLFFEIIVSFRRRYLEYSKFDSKMMRS